MERLSCSKQSYQADRYHINKVIFSICENESCWSEQAVKWSFKVIKHAKIANQTSKEIGSPYLKKMGYPLIDQLNAIFSSTSVQAWSLRSSAESPICWPAFFMCTPTWLARLAFIGENLVLEKAESPLILFYFKMENKTRKKTLKKWLHSFWKKRIFEKPKSSSWDQVTYWEGTSKR